MAPCPIPSGVAACGTTETVFGARWDELAPAVRTTSHANQSRDRPRAALALNRRATCRPAPREALHPRCETLRFAGSIMSAR
jgi:hypothetical protein